ncbi:MAG TPA: IPT/TIG domain-containing protein [Thermomicrobiales bacterium]|jgi:hypothetical protein
MVTLTGIDPEAVPVGIQGFTLTVTGTGFTAGSTVLLNGNSLPTTYVSATTLLAAILATDLQLPRILGIAVKGEGRELSDSLGLAVRSLPATFAAGDVWLPPLPALAVIGSDGTVLATPEGEAIGMER